MGLEHLFERYTLVGSIEQPASGLVTLATPPFTFYGLSGDPIECPIAIVPIEPLPDATLSGFYDHRERRMQFTPMDYVLHLDKFVLPVRLDDVAKLVSAPLSEAMGNDALDLHATSVAVRIANKDGGFYPFTVHEMIDIPLVFLYLADGAYYLNMPVTDGTRFLNTKNPVAQFPIPLDDLLQVLASGNYDGRPFRAFSRSRRVESTIVEPAENLPAAPASRFPADSFKTAPMPGPEGAAADSGVPPVATASDIKAYLDERIIGQERAKRRLSVVGANYLRGRVEPVLLYGPTGVGKSVSAKVLAQFLGVPYRKERLTEVTKPGYVGGDVYQPFVSLACAQETDRPIGIVIYDELDKLTDPQDFVGGDGVQNQLLSLVERESIRPDVHRYARESVLQGQKPNFFPEEIDTSGVLVVFTGAFSRPGRGGRTLQEIAQDRLKSRDCAIGFGSQREAHVPRIVPDDFFAYGLKPELVGRLTHRIALDELTRDELRRILTQKKGNLVDDYTGLLITGYGRDLVIEPDAIDAIIDAVPKNVGARGLDTVCSEVMGEVIADLEKYTTHEGQVILAASAVTDILARL